MSCSCEAQASRRRDDGCWHGKDALASKSFSHRNSTRPANQLIARAGPWKTNGRQRRSARPKMHKVTTLAVSTAGEHSCKVPGFFQRLRLARRKCWGSTESLLHSTAFINCVPASFRSCPTPLPASSTTHPFRLVIHLSVVKPPLRCRSFYNTSEADRSSYLLSD